ncbi:MAG: DNA repair protein RecO [marine benthic group bacterium]|nr:DNA repair protein RecO [Gemmatimonadota bacterium]MCL7975247.1 DNA repair protein RecO [Gemmatimonadota bacterium]
MPIVTTSCLVLQTYRFGDTSKILRLLTFDHGPLSALARGALRPKSRMSGVLEPFVEGKATLYLKPNRDLHTLSGFDLVRSRQSLGSDMERFAGASVLAELVLRLAPAERDERVFSALRRGLDDLVQAPPRTVTAVSVARIWELVRVLGFEPALNRCLSCGREVDDSERARFDTREGGVLCTDCSAAGDLLEPAELAVFRKLAVDGDIAVPAISARHVRLLKEFIRIHVAEDLQIRSLEFLGPADA